MPGQAQESDAFPFMGRATEARSATGNIDRFLTMLADSPNNVEALSGAGNTALDLRDADATLGFFVRTNDLSPRQHPLLWLRNKGNRRANGGNWRPGPAQAFLDAIAAEDEIYGHSFRGAEGQEIERLDPR